MGFIFGRKRRSRNRSSRRSRDRSFTANIPLMRWFGPLTTGSGIIGLIMMVVTERIDLSSFDQWLSKDAPAGDVASDRLAERDTHPLQPVNLPSRSENKETIRIASFNIRIFGEKKANNQAVMEQIAAIVTQFEIVAIQEIRGGSSTPIDALVRLIRASGRDYDATISQPIGESNQVESYAFVFDRTRISLVPGSAYLVNDDEQRMSREPMVASFETRPESRDGRQPFRFNLINAHTDPDEVTNRAIENEMDVLDDVFVSVRQWEWEQASEEDTIMLGDLNVNTKGLRELGEIPNVVSILGDVKTNTRKSKTYDHILADRTQTTEFTGRAGVLDLESFLGLVERRPSKSVTIYQSGPNFQSSNRFLQPRLQLDRRPVAATRRHSKRSHLRRVQIPRGRARGGIHRAHAAQRQDDGDRQRFPPYFRR